MVKVEIPKTGYAHRRKFLKEIFALFRPNFARQDKGGTLARFAPHLLFFIERKLKNNFVSNLERRQKMGGFARSGLFTLCAARS